MKIHLPVIVCLISWRSLLAVMPTNPYYFAAPDVAGLLPFTEKELLTLKKQKILSVTETGDAPHGGLYTTLHYLDSNGRVLRTEERWPDGKREGKCSTIFLYNAAGQLVSKKLKGYRQEIHDTIVYDEKGRMIYFHAHTFEPGKRKRDDYLRIDFDMRFIGNTGSYYQLADSSDKENVRIYWLDQENRVIKIESNTVVDTVSWERKGDKTLELRRFKKRGESGLHPGETLEYDHGLLVSQTRHDRLYDEGHVSKLYYFYDEQGKLLRMEYQNKYAAKYFFTYGYTGLCDAEVYLENDAIHVIRFTYAYR